MYSWKIKKISDNEYHIIEARYVNEPEFILAKCSGPVPAGQIVSAMRLSQAIMTGEHSLGSGIASITNGIKRFEQERKSIEKGDVECH